MALAPRTVQKLPLKLGIKHPLFIVFGLASFAANPFRQIRDEKLLAERRPMTRRSRGVRRKPCAPPCAEFAYTCVFNVFRDFPVRHEYIARRVDFGTEAYCDRLRLRCRKLWVA